MSLIEPPWYAPGFDSAETPRPAPLSVGERAVQIARSHLGEQETGGPNQGAIVLWACRLWLSEHRFLEMYQRGALAWCAGFACTALREAGSASILHVASLDVQTLLERCQGRGLAWLPQDGRELEPGDLVFFLRNGRPGHVGLAQAPVVAQRLKTIEGNAGNAARERSYAAGDPQICAFARVV